MAESEKCQNVIKRAKKKERAGLVGPLLVMPQQCREAESVHINNLSASLDDYVQKKKNTLVNATVLI